MSFDIVIENKRAHAVTVYNTDGSMLCSIGPRERFHCSTDDPYRMLARYDRVVFTPDGVDLSIRPNWTEPERRWPTMLTLKDGPAVESRFFQGAAITLMRGIPVIVDCRPEDEWAIFSAVLLNVATAQRIESREHPGCYEFVSVLTDEPTLRTEAELERLQKIMEATAAEEQPVVDENTEQENE